LSGAVTVAAVGCSVPPLNTLESPLKRRSGMSVSCGLWIQPAARYTKGGTGSPASSRSNHVPI